MTDDPTETFEQGAKAVEAASNAVGKLVDGAAAIIKAPVVQAIGGLVGGNYIIELNRRQRERFKKRTAEILKDDGVKEPIPLSLSLAVPLVAAAENESRPELEELWARLMATGMNPDRTHEVRIDFIATLKQFDPLDAKLLQVRILNHEGGGNSDSMGLFRRLVTPDDDDLIISIKKLEHLGCFLLRGGIDTCIATPYGRKLIAACSKR